MQRRSCMYTYPVWMDTGYTLDIHWIHVAMACVVTATRCHGSIAHNTGHLTGRQSGEMLRNLCRNLHQWQGKLSIVNSMVGRTGAQALGTQPAPGGGHRNETLWVAPADGEVLQLRSVAWQKRFLLNNICKFFLFLACSMRVVLFGYTPWWLYYGGPTKESVWAGMIARWMSSIFFGVCSWKMLELKNRNYGVFCT